MLFNTRRMQKMLVKLDHRNIYRGNLRVIYLTIDIKDCTYLPSLSLTKIPLLQHLLIFLFPRGAFSVALKRYPYPRALIRVYNTGIPYTKSHV